MDAAPLYIAFEGDKRLSVGPLAVVALAAKRRLESPRCGTVLVFNAATSAAVDLDLRGSDVEVHARFPAPKASDVGDAEEAAANPARGPGRPKLGVIGREVTLLPRHWDWLNAQPGGASVALRKLVDEARRTTGQRDRRRRSQEAAYRFMSVIAGDKPHFEEACRALFAGNADAFGLCTQDWPRDIREHALELASEALNKA